MKTYVPKKGDVQHRWWLIDAEGVSLGRLATQAATLLMGKHKPIYVPYQDVGDYVIVVNAEKIRLTGLKWENKRYRRHSGYPGGLKEVTARKMWEKHPERLVERAVSRMLPKNKLRRVYERKLKVYAGETHPHQGQLPVRYTIEGSVSPENEAES